jgi:hypothetical protein
MVTMLAFVVLGGGTAMAAYVVSSNSQIGPGTVSGHKPPTGKHSNLIVGSVNGQDVADNSLGGADVNEKTLTGNTRRLVWRSSPTGFYTPFATLDPYKIEGYCVKTPSGGTSLGILVNGPAGTVDSMWSLTANDVTDDGTQSIGAGFGANTDTYVADNGAGPNAYKRMAGTAMVQSGSVLIQIDFNGVADGRNQGSCFIYGTATRAT